MKYIAFVLLAIVAIAAAVPAKRALPIRSLVSRGVRDACDNNPCGSGETCCVTPDGAGCCPAANACCCPDQSHCCQSPYQCTCSGTCPGSDCSCTNCASTGQCESSKAF